MNSLARARTLGNTELTFSAQNHNTRKQLSISCKELQQAKHNHKEVRNKQEISTIQQEIIRILTRSDEARKLKLSQQRLKYFHEKTVQNNKRLSFNEQERDNTDIVAYAYATLTANSMN